MIGKQKCKILKEIRQKIAEENNIPYQTKECTHTGNCSGTCPFCESEVRYLETQLKKKASLGIPVRIAAICAGVAATVTGCSVIAPDSEKATPTPTEEVIVLSGEVGYPYEPEPTETSAPVTKKNSTITVPIQSREPVEIGYDELSGYVPYN